MVIERPSADLLLGVLERARTVGFLGPGPLRAHLDHADAFVDALPVDARRLVDLGSGGGVPALPILLRRPALQGVLVEAMQKRAVFLGWAVAELGLADRVRVVAGRAEHLAHQPDHRGRADVVTARGFGPPALAAECAVGFLRVGGMLLVSEPPTDQYRWPADSLAELGLSPSERVGAVATMRLVESPAPDIPRATHLLVKRPRF